MTTVSSYALRTLLDGPAEVALLDVREKRASDAAHIVGGSNVPRRELEWRIGGLVPVRATPVCLYDEDLGIAPRAADDLRALGYTDVRVLDGGLPAWRAAGHPVTAGNSVPSKHFGELVQHHEAVPTVTADELRGWLDDGRRLTLIDVRTPEEHARETIPGAVNVPGFELPHRLDALLDDDATVVVHCSGRTRSIIGAATLKRSGVERVVALENGTMGWLLAGHEVEHGAARDATDAAPAGQSAVRRWRRTAETAGVRYLPPPRAWRVLQAAGAAVGTVYLFDVRTRAEHRDGHAAGAQWAPSGQLVQLTDTYVAVRDAAIALICDGGVRSAISAYWLRRMGFARVIVVDGGLPAWEDAGLPTEAGAAAEVLGLAEARAAVPAVSPAQLAGAVDGAASPLIVDVDTSARHAQGHVPGARWVSPTRLESRLEQVGAAPDRPVVFTCRDGALSTVSAWKATRAGWTAASVLAGGLAAWRDAGQPVDGGAADVDDPDDVFVHPVFRGPDAMRAYLDWEVALADDDQQ